MIPRTRAAHALRATGSMLGGASLALMASVSASADEARACDRVLRIEGTEPAASTLRAALHEGALGAKTTACESAVVSVSERGGGYAIALAVDGARVEREVAGIAAAAMWIEGWLTAGLGAEPGGIARTETAATGAQDPPASRGPLALQSPRGEPASDRPPRVVFVAPSAQIGLLGTGAAGTDGSLWGGAELFARLHMTPAIWLGAALGVEGDSAWTGPAMDMDDTSRVALRASARGGARLPVVPRLDVILGMGAGVVWGTAMRQFPTDDEDIEQGGLFLEACSDAAVRLHRNLSLLGGLGARGRFLSRRATGDALERLVPDAMPAVTGELRLGGAWDFGGAL